MLTVYAWGHWVNAAPSGCRVGINLYVYVSRARQPVDVQGEEGSICLLTGFAWGTRGEGGSFKLQGGDKAVRHQIWAAFERQDDDHKPPSEHVYARPLSPALSFTTPHLTNHRLYAWASLHSVSSAEYMSDPPSITPHLQSMCLDLPPQCLT